MVAAMLVAFAVLALREGARPVAAAGTAIDGASRGVPVVRHGSAGARDDAPTRPREADRTEVVRPAAPAAVTAAPLAAPLPRVGQIVVQVLEKRSRRPLPDVALAVRFGHGFNEFLELPVRADGIAFLEARLLRDSEAVAFVVDDPEFLSGLWYRVDRSIDELLRSREPFQILVDQGTWRDFHVVDPDGAPVSGATFEEHSLRAAPTGPDGRGRVRMTEKPRLRVTISAPGFRQEYVEVPPEDELWVIQLGRANRLEFALFGCDDPRGYHVELDLPATMTQRTFYQEKYVQTPGRPRERTPGRWRPLSYRGASAWSLGFNADGVAVVDQLYDAGTIAAVLLRFDEIVDRRTVTLPADGRTVRTEFVVPAQPAELVGRVVDESGRPVAGVLVRAAPLGGAATIDLFNFPGFPVWSPQTESGANGAFRLPAPADPGTVLVFHKRGLADRALTVAEIAAVDGRVVLETGRAVIVEVRDRDGEPIDGGWTTGNIILHARPSVHIGHDVWRDVSPSDHPAAGGREIWNPFFLLADLPSGIVEIRFLYLDEVLRHDTRFPTARLVSRHATDELGMGK